MTRHYGQVAMLIIAGHLVVRSAERDGYVAGCRAVVEAARVAPGCLEFSVTGDSVEPDRVIVYERWQSEAQLLVFRESGPDDGQQEAILDAAVKRYEISEMGPP